MKTIIAHVDLDAFFASVEQLDNPLYRNKPVIVGGNPKGRGVVSAASYEARKYGVKSAMPTAQAYRLCPEGIFINSRISRYRQLSYKFRAILSSLSLTIEPLSLDEAYLDLTDNTLNSKDPFHLARYIQKRILKETGLWASVGIGPNKFIAKIASELDKPKGLLIITPDEVLDFLSPQPVSSLWGVGKKTLSKLHNLEVETIEDLRGFSEFALTGHFGQYGRSLFQMARGIDTRVVSNKRESKSLGAERTFSNDISDHKDLERYLFSLCLQVSKRAKSKKIWGKTLTLKYKSSDFNSHTKSKTLTKFIQNENEMYKESVNLLSSLDLDFSLRLIGISLSNFREDQSQSSQLTLF